MGVGIFGLLPTSILGEIGESLPSASNRYTYIVNVPNLYHSLGRGGVQTLREAAGWERVKEREQTMQSRRDAATATATEKEARLKHNYKKAKAEWDSFGGTPGWGYSVIAMNNNIPIA